MLKRKKAPYARTTVHPLKTQGQINAMLVEYGVEKYAWDLDLNHNVIQLMFEIQLMVDEKLVTHSVKVSPGVFLEPHKTWDKEAGKHITTNAPNLAAAMRLLRSWVKSRLEAISYGLFSAEDEFLSQIVISKSGETIGERIIPKIEQLKLEDKTRS